MASDVTKGNHAATSGIEVVLTLILAAVLVGFTTGLLQRDELSAQNVFPARAKMLVDESEKDQRMSEIEQRFEQAVAMLHAKQYDFAITALHRVLALSPRLVDAHVNMGFALHGAGNYKAAADFFGSAIELDHYKANAYWGLAVSLEKLGDFEGALGAMRTFIHLSPGDNQFLRKARSALWEWETRLKRGPLPENERAWLEARGKQWQERNEPQVDLPAGDAAEQIELLSSE